MMLCSQQVSFTRPHTHAHTPVSLCPVQYIKTMSHHSSSTISSHSNVHTSNYASASTLAPTTHTHTPPCQHPSPDSSTSIHPTHQYTHRSSTPTTPSPQPHTQDRNISNHIYNFMPERILGESSHNHFHTPSPSKHSLKSVSPLSNITPSSPIIAHTTLKVIQPQDIEVGAYIGEGSFGTVRRGVWRGMDVALKILRLDDTTAAASIRGATCVSASAASGQQKCAHDTICAESHSEQTLTNGVSHISPEYLQEIQTMALVCNHANVIQLVGMVSEISSFSPCIVTAFYINGSVYDKLFIPTELTGHDIFSSQSLYPISQLIQWAIETAQGVHHLHQEHVIHRDLATRNLLLDDSCHVRVADFGFSRTKEAGASKGFTKSELGKSVSV
jgi:hypothetical protein